MLETMPAARKAPAAEAFPPMVRIPVETRERLARAADAMSKRALTELPASVVVRAAIERGLDALESELGIARVKR